MKLNTLLGNIADHFTETTVHGESLSIGWSSPDHVSLVRASKVVSSLTANTQMGVLRRGAWLEELPQYLPVDEAKMDLLVKYTEAHFEDDHEETIPTAPDELKKLISRYRAERPEPRVEFSETDYLNLCREIQGWVVSVSPLVDDNGEELNYLELPGTAQLGIIRALSQDTIMGMVAEAFELVSLDEEVKND
jgi:hypothetical protein